MSFVAVIDAHLLFIFVSWFFATFYLHVIMNRMLIINNRRRKQKCHTVFFLDDKIQNFFILTTLRNINMNDSFVNL